MYSIIRFMQKDVFILIGRLESTSFIRTQKPLYVKRRICTHKPLRAHKLYTYAKAAFHANCVFIRKISYSAQAVYLREKTQNLRKATYRAQKPYNIRTQTATVVSNKSTRKDFFFKRHGMQQAGQFHTSQS